MNAVARSNSSESQKNADLVLIVDDEPAICWGFERLLREEGHRVCTASSAELGLELARKERPALIILDVRLPGMDGITALPKFLEVTGGAAVVVMTAFGDLDTAVAAVRQGASDYLVKPFRLDDAVRACQNAMRQRPDSGFAHQVKRQQPGSLVGRSTAIQQAFRQIALVADSDLSVLITGETGTGKELVAAAIHQHSSRHAAPYLPIAPVAFNPELIESELFGHAQGAFTGASTARPGVFEAAQGGTVLLDEIGDLGLSTQVKLLRVLESGHFSRVGETHLRQCNVRILAATNTDLHQAVAHGHFREDLFFRLNGVHIHLPPLRERIEDIEILCHHFLRELDYPHAAEALEPATLAHLQTRSWLGNVRELRNALEHAAVVARGRGLRPEDFPPPQPGRTDSDMVGPDIAGSVTKWSRQALSDDLKQGNLYAEFLKTFEPALLRQVLLKTGGNKVKAAELLGIHRATLRERLRAYDLR